MRQLVSIFVAEFGRNETFFIFFGALFVAGFVIGLIVYFQLGHQREKFNKNIAKFTGNDKVYEINLMDQTARYFNFYNLKEANLSSYQKFLELFVLKDRENLSFWIYTLIKSDFDIKGGNNVFVSEYTVGQDKILNKYIYSKCVVECVGADKDKQAVELVVHLLTNIPSKHEREKNEDFHKYLYTDAEVKTAFTVQDVTKGCVVNIKFYRKKKGLIDINSQVLRFHILNCAYAVLKEKAGYNYFWLDPEDNESLFILTNKANNIYSISNLVKKLYPVINSFAEVKGLNSSYEFVIIGARKSELSKDFEKMKSTLREYNESCRDSGKYQATYTNESYVDTGEEALGNELNKVIKNSMLNVKFSPIYKVTNKRVITYGYLVNPYLRGTNFLTIENLKPVAMKYDQIKEISSLIARKSVPTFNSEKLSNSNKLVIYINDKEAQFVNRIYAHFNNIENTHIIFVFRNSVIAQKEKEPSFFASINLIASRLDCEFYVDINIDDYILKDATYKLFDGFVLNYKSAENKKFENRDFIKVRNLCEKFFGFKKPIIAVNMGSWQEIEMLAKVGINTFSSNAIAEESENLLPISTKSQKRLLNLYKG